MNTPAPAVDPRIQGRMGRGRYVLALLIVMVPVGLLYYVAATERSDGLFWTAVCLNLLVLHPVQQRLHDLGHSGVLALLLFVPVANLMLGLYLLLWPGEQGPNAYGDPPDRVPARPQQV